MLVAQTNDNDKKWVAIHSSDYQMNKKLRHLPITPCVLQPPAFRALLRVIIPIDEFGVSSKLIIHINVRVEITRPRAKLIREAGGTKVGVAHSEALVEAVDHAAGAQRVGSRDGLAAADADRCSTQAATGDLLPDINGAGNNKSFKVATSSFS